MSKVFIYGSIKKGFFNHGRFDFDKNVKFIGVAELKGAQMYNLGSYPCLVLTDNQEDVVLGELYEYHDEECEKKIKRMEEGAGYKEVEVEIEGMKVKTFIFEKVPENKKLVVDGVWR